MTIFRFLSIFLGIAVVSILPLRAETPLNYQAEIVPLLREYCVGCHNGDDYEGEFSVETFAALREGGETEEKTMIVPGKPEESYLMQTILRKTKPAMPPKKEPQPKAEEISMISRWIAEGAKGPLAGEDLSMLSTLSVPKIAASPTAAKSVTARAISPDGKWEFFARFGHLEWRQSDGSGPVHRIQVGEGKINAMHVSTDGKRIVLATGITGLKGEALLLDATSGEIQMRLGEGHHRDILFDAEFSPDGTLLATAGYDQVIHLWDLATGKVLRSLASHNAAIYDLAFSPDGTVLASASGDGTCKIWLVATGDRLDTLNQPEAEQYRVCFTPDGNSIIAAGADNRIRLWSFLSKTKATINPLREARFGHEAAIVEMDLSPDGGILATTSADRSLKLWSVPELELLETLETQTDVVSVVQFTHDGRELRVSRLDGSSGNYAVHVSRSQGKGVGRADLGRATVENPAVNSATVAATSVAATTVVATSVAATSVVATTVRLEEKVGGVNPDLVRRSEIMGVISRPGEEDVFPFSAKKGESWIFEVNAAQSKSKLDSRLSILDANQKPVTQVVLQAVRDSWLTFRGKDSSTSTDFRVQNWAEMELNEFLFVNGEVVKLWHYPRGPDSGFDVYPGFGSRRTFFQTTAMAHPVGQPCYIVRAYPPSAVPGENGLPRYPIFYENDDDPDRRLGSDSKLRFTVPEDGQYFVQIGDVRGFGGEGYSYTLTARNPKPGVSVNVTTKNPKIAPGSGTELLFTATREDGYEGAIQVSVSGLPESLSMVTPVVIEAGQDRAYAMLEAGEKFAGLADAEAKQVIFLAKAIDSDVTAVEAVGGFGPITLQPNSTLRVEIQPDGDSGKIAADGILEFTIHPGETITAMAIAHRNGFKGIVELGKADAGRNLPFGIYVDNIGLNGLMIPEDRNEQKFFITASKVASETVRVFHLETTADGGHGTKVVRLRVVKEGIARSQ